MTDYRKPARYLMNRAYRGFAYDPGTAMLVTALIVGVAVWLLAEGVQNRREAETRRVADFVEFLHELAAAPPAEIQLTDATVAARSRDDLVHTAWVARDADRPEAGLQCEFRMDTSGDLWLANVAIVKKEKTSTIYGRYRQLAFGVCRRVWKKMP